MRPHRLKVNKVATRRLIEMLLLLVLTLPEGVVGAGHLTREPLRGRVVGGETKVADVAESVEASFPVSSI